ncbi:hypothetical protein EJB05_13600, partial [Eragrostis curvula]
MERPHISAMLTSLLLLLTTAAFPSVAALSSNDTDLAALLAFRSQLSDPLGFLQSNWTSEVSICHWVGVSCSRRWQRVTALELPGVPLKGELTPHLGNLSFLHVLNLTGTDLVGSVPEDVGRLPRLIALDLSNNSLSGTIPPSVGNLTRLQVLALNNNQLNSQIPDELRSLHNLRYLSLAVNYLGGLIPNFSCSSMPLLTHLHIHKNSLTGSIPQGFGTMFMLQELEFRYNLLSGPAPPNIFNMSRLEVLSIGMNNLTGPIPGNESFKLPMLQVIDFYMNRFTSPIPSGLAACRHLQILQIPGNLFVGPVPTWLAQLSQLIGISMGGTDGLFGTIPGILSNLTKLEILDIMHSNVSWPIPAELGTMKQLTVLQLAFNQLTGPIPNFTGNLSALTNLHLSSNQMTGPVPSALGNMRSLQHLSIDSNLFRGDLDFLASLGNCRQLEDISISNNPFTSGNLNPIHVGNLSTNLLVFEAINSQIIGSLPATLSNLSSLHIINLGNNQLTNAIPEPLTMLRKLQVLDLSMNRMSGMIPKRICTLHGLFKLLLSNNKFSGSIPDCVANLTMLQHIDLSYNKLSSTVTISLFHLDSLIEMYLSHNFLSGALPSDLRYMKMVDQMDLSANRFVGSLPISFSNHQMLTYFNLSHNSFEGSIPDSFRQLTNLWTLDLSSNNLSGTIPSYLANFTYLSSLNLSFNNLQGQIPNGGVFSNLTWQSMMGNVRLCGGAPRLGFSPCQYKPHPTHHQHFLKIVLPIATVAFCFTIVFICLIGGKMIKKKKQSVNASADMEEVISHRSVSSQEIVRATNNFNQDNLLGVGSFGAVFRGQLDDGMVVAVKVLNMEMAEAIQSFDAECRALRMARHRNLIKILSTCSNMDFRVLVLQYMPNGSLDEHLHGDARQCLGFLDRLGIMLDVSMAMEYLHHGYCEVVLHCDLKPSNVLFDEEMTAHVADFGIARLLLGDDNSMVSTNMLGTIGYMAPEYAIMGKASRKCDVFSFGIMLLETFTGKRPTDPMFAEGLSLRQWVFEAFPARLLEVVDDKLLQHEATRLCFNQQFDTSLESSLSCTRDHLFVSIFELGLICSSESPEQRISVKDIVAKLEDIKKDYSMSGNANSLELLNEMIYMEKFLMSH